jgi:hypothetical protein
VDLFAFTGRFATEVDLRPVEDGSREASFIVEVTSGPYDGRFLRVYAREEAALAVEREMQNSLLQGRALGLDGHWGERPLGSDPAKPGEQRPVVATHLWFIDKP